MPRSSSSSPPQSPRRSVVRPDSQFYTPSTPSRLRASVVASPESLEQPEMPEGEINDGGKHSPKSHGIEFSSNGGFPEPEQPAPSSGYDGPPFEDVQGRLSEPTHREADARTRLLEDYHRSGACGSRHCSHGTFSPGIRSHKSSVSSNSSVNGFGGRWPGELNDDGNAHDNMHNVLGDTLTDGVLPQRTNTMSTTKWLAERHGIKNSRAM